MSTHNKNKKIINYNKVHKLALITYLILIVEETPNENDQKFSLCILTRNTYFPRRFSIFQRNFIPIFPRGGLPKICWKIFLT